MLDVPRFFIQGVFATFVAVKEVNWSLQEPQRSWISKSHRDHGYPAALDTLGTGSRCLMCGWSKARKTSLVAGPLTTTSRKKCRAAMSVAYPGRVRPVLCRLRGKAV